jgi:hypothetical protein
MMKSGEPPIKPPPPTVYPNTVDNVKLRPKLKKSDRELSAEQPYEATQEDILTPKRMMGFRECCEKVYDRRHARCGTEMD